MSLADCRDSAFLQLRPALEPLHACGHLQPSLIPAAFRIPGTKPDYPGPTNELWADLNDVGTGSYPAITETGPSRSKDVNLLWIDGPTRPTRLGWPSLGGLELCSAAGSQGSQKEPSFLFLVEYDSSILVLVNHVDYE